MVSRIFKYTIAFVMFFTFLYFGFVSIAGVQLNLLWKIPILVFAVLVFVSKFNGKFPKYFFYGILFSLKNLINIGPVSYLTTSLMEMFKYSVIPLFTEMFRALYRNKEKKLEDLAKFICVFILLTALPFLLGIIDAPVSTKSLEKYGLEEASIFIGVFLRPHGAAITYAAAILIMIIFFNREQDGKTKFFYFVCLAIGMVALYNTFVRTGWVIFFAGLIFIYFWDQKLSAIIKRIPAMLVGVGFLAIFYINSPSVQMRLSDTNIYTEKQGNEEVEVGSGRLKFAKASITYFMDSGFSGMFLGLGLENAKDLMAEEVGKRYVAHNGFLDILQNTGILGTILFILFAFYLIKIAWTLNRNSPHRQPLLTLLLAYFFTLLFQGAHYIWIQILLSIYLALALLEQEKYIKKDQRSVEINSDKLIEDQTK